MVQPEQTSRGGGRRRPSAARARILATADRLFYAKGIRAVGVDRVVAEARVTRVTFYRHFPSKDHLIAAYLNRRLEHDQGQFARLRRDHPDDPRAVLTALVQALAKRHAAPGFRGCAYANLAAEYCDQDHPARAIAANTALAPSGNDRTARRPGRRASTHRRPSNSSCCEPGRWPSPPSGSPKRISTAFALAWTALVDQSTEPR